MDHKFSFNKWLLLGCGLAFLLLPNIAGADTLKYPLLKNNTGKTVIERIAKPNKQLSDFMIISQKGTVIIVDAYDTPEKFIDAVKPDAICITHMQHLEHVDMGLISKFTGQKRVKKSFQKVESFTVKDVKVTGIACAHGEDGKVADQEPEDVIYVFEVDGLRIAHLGGCGQKEFSETQLQKLGKIDIAMIEFVSYSSIHMSVENCIHIAQQLDPVIIIPTHRNVNTIPEIGEMLNRPVEEVPNVLTVSKGDLNNGDKKIVELTNTLE